jgi:hypothetical protein
MARPRVCPYTTHNASSQQRGRWRWRGDLDRAVGRRKRRRRRGTKSEKGLLLFATVLLFTLSAACFSFLPCVVVDVVARLVEHNGGPPSQSMSSPVTPLASLLLAQRETNGETLDNALVVNQQLQQPQQQHPVTWKAKLPFPGCLCYKEECPPGGHPMYQIVLDLFELVGHKKIYRGNFDAKIRFDPAKYSPLDGWGTGSNPEKKRGQDNSGGQALLTDLMRRSLEQGQCAIYSNGGSAKGSNIRHLVCCRMRQSKKSQTPTREAATVATTTNTTTTTTTTTTRRRKNPTVSIRAKNGEALCKAMLYLSFDHLSFYVIVARGCGTHTGHVPLTPDQVLEQLRSPYRKRLLTETEQQLFSSQQQQRPQQQQTQQLKNSTSSVGVVVVGDGGSGAKRRKNDTATTTATNDAATATINEVVIDTNHVHATARPKKKTATRTSKQRTESAFVDVPQGTSGRRVMHESALGSTEDNGGGEDGVHTSNFNFEQYIVLQEEGGIEEDLKHHPSPLEQQPPMDDANHNHLVLYPPEVMLDFVKEMVELCQRQPLIAVQKYILQVQELRNRMKAEVTRGLTAGPALPTPTTQGAVFPFGQRLVHSLPPPVATTRN